MSSLWSDRRGELRIFPTPLTADLSPVELSAPVVRALVRGPRVFGVQTLDVPLLALKDNRVDFDFGEKIDFSTRSPLDSLSFLASTQTGFLAPTAPDYRFPGLLADVTALCDRASVVYAKEDEHAFRGWVQAEIAALVKRGGTLDELSRLATSLPLPRQEMLTVPLIYLNHMWRQGNPTFEPTRGPSAMPDPLNALLMTLEGSSGILPRLSQIVFSMRSVRFDGRSDGQLLSYRDINALEQVRPYFWFLRDSEAELNLYLGFYVLESFGAPLPAWACLALECAAADDVELGVFALRCVHAALRNVYFCVRHIIPQIDPVGFRKVQITGGWIEDEVTGVNSGYQLPFMMMLDALFRVDFTHPGTIKSKANNLRFVPRLWQDFFQSVREHDPALASWVRGRRCAELTDAYQRCVDLFTLFRTMHRYLAGQVLRGATTTGRSFDSYQRNYRVFMSEMSALRADTAATGISAESG